MPLDPVERWSRSTCLRFLPTQCTHMIPMDYWSKGCPSPGFLQFTDSFMETHLSLGSDLPHSVLGSGARWKPQDGAINPMSLRSALMFESGCRALRGVLFMTSIIPFLIRSSASVEQSRTASYSAPHPSCREKILWY